MVPARRLQPYHTHLPLARPPSPATPSHPARAVRGDRRREVGPSACHPTDLSRFRPAAHITPGCACAAFLINVWHHAFRSPALRVRALGTAATAGRYVPDVAPPVSSWPP